MGGIERIGPRGEKARKLKDEADSLSIHDKQRMISDFIEGNEFNPSTHRPSRVFVTYSPDGVEKLIYEITEDQELVPSNLKAVEHMVTWSVHNLFYGNKILELPINQICQAVKYWYSSSVPIEKPKIFKWQGEEGISLRRLPFAIGTGPTPLFDEIMGRTTNSEALMAFIGSLFFDGSDVQQYVWWRGQGGNGKGAVSRLLAKALGRLYSSQQVPQVGDRFWTAGIRDARLVVFPDCNNGSWVTSGMFKSLSGGDPVRVEIKNGAVFTEKLMAKYMFLSNETPDCSSESADQRRIIYCDSKPFEGEPNPRYEQELWKEAGYWLSKCCEMYQKGANQAFIATDRESMKELLQTNEEDFIAYFDTNFEIDKYSYVKPADFHERLKANFPKKKDQKEFRAWLERTHGIKKTAYKSSKFMVEYRYCGLKMHIYCMSS